jgi:cyclohexanone monooxygenase
VFTNVVPSIEQDVNFISGVLGHMQGQGRQQVEAEAAAEEAWVKEVAAVAESTLYTQGTSWYLGSNIPGKPRVFLAWIGFPTYVERCRQIANKGYEGFSFA